MSSSKPRPSQVKPPNPRTPSRRSSASSNSSTQSFHSTTTHPPPLRLSPSTEALHLSSSHTLKLAANAQFSAGDYSSALGTYDKAIAELPSYLDYELAVLQSNIAACHVRMEEWREAVEAAGKGWEGLERVDPLPKAKGKAKTDEKEGAVVEIDEEEEAEVLKKLELDDRRKQDVKRIRTKLLLRKARAKYMLGTMEKKKTKEAKDERNPFAKMSSMAGDGKGSMSAWSNLSGALADYQMLADKEFFGVLPVADQRTVRNMLVVLPGLVEKARETETAEMMGKLKELGNGILKPFGLSTDMFKMEKDPNSGGMSLRFDGGAKK